MDKTDKMNTPKSPKGDLDMGNGIAKSPLQGVGGKKINSIK